MANIHYSEILTKHLRVTGLRTGRFQKSISNLLCQTVYQHGRQTSKESVVCTGD